MSINLIRILVFALVLLTSCEGQKTLTQSANKSGIITAEITAPTVDFAKSVLSKTIAKDAFPYQVNLKIDATLEDQAFNIETANKQITITGGDEKGLMYGGLELVEMIDLDYDLSNLKIQKTPFQKNRGLKFNIPLDARCPSYDDTGDAAQKNIENMWDLDFWKSYFDRMAMHRYNVLSLWTPNLFQVMTDLPSYPKLALENVCVTTAKPKGKVGEWDDAGGVNEVVLNNLKVVKKMTIAEKIAFWQEVFDYANSRGVDLYLYTWNIYTNGTYGQYGLTDEIDNQKTKAYYREAIRVFLETYPQFKGIGITAGERMLVAKGLDVADERERWLWETYGLGILDYKKNNPDRTIHFIHRVWYTKFDQVLKYWADYPDPFDVGYKYAKARIYSSPKESPFIGSLKNGLKESELKCWWNLRNDDIFVYRWGDPDYVRSFIKNLPEGITAGYHMGSDGYVWGKVFSDKNPSINGTMELDKHWYKFMLWGRLGYDNQLTNAHFKKMLTKRYGTKQPDLLFNTWQAASKVIPQINRFSFEEGDRHWAPEMCASRESFKYVPKFRQPRHMPKLPILTPKDFVIASQNGNVQNKVTPYAIRDSLSKWGDFVLGNISKINAHSAELKSVKADLTAFAWLGKYYAQKIEAATLLETLASQQDQDRTVLLDCMSKATTYWNNYADISDQFYHTQMYSRVNTMDWQALKKEVQFDENLIRNMTTTFSLPQQLALKDTDLQINYPYKNTRKWIEIHSTEAALAMVFLYDERGELMDFYRHPCEEGTSVLVWEDLQWTKKGNYQLVLNINGKTSVCSFKR